MNYEYMGDAVRYEVCVNIQKEKNAITIQLFRAHTSEPYGELQVPKAHAKQLSELLSNYARECSEETKAPLKDA